MTLYSTPPAVRDFSEVKPTLLVAWWATLFCTCLILLRLAGRYIRVERLFPEDKIMALALVPLYGRIACVHVVLLYGTNNADLAHLPLASDQISRRVTASKLILAGRVFYAATLWTLKLTTLAFLARLVGASMKQVYQRLVDFLRLMLAATFLAVVVSALAECQPFSHAWQVLPDPGPKCRQGFAHLLTVGICSAVMDAVLVIFPVPIIMSTRIPTKRKILLVMLFCFGFLAVAVTLCRIPQIIKQHGDQVTRTMWASVELLAATTVANLVALGSFLRDSGARKTKFRPDHRSSGTASRRQVEGTTKSWYENLQPSAAHPQALATAHGHPSSDDRVPSPTESHDSLLQHGKRASFARAADASEPTQPSPVLSAGRVGLWLHRR
ncbi:hypothetical protein RJ55_06441 [Drechmeria coniospora]|nr:hypothetical protein RJ55_06441 [Drechmeria coniospora]